MVQRVWLRDCSVLNEGKCNFHRFAQNPNFVDSQQCFILSCSCLNHVVLRYFYLHLYLSRGLEKDLGEQTI